MHRSGLLPLALPALTDGRHRYLRFHPRSLLLERSALRSRAAQEDSKKYNYS